MAKTPEEAIEDHIKAIGDRKEIKLAETIHLPFQHYDAYAERVYQWNRPEEVPQYFKPPAPNWADTYCRLDSREPVIEGDNKVAFRIEATRFNPDGSVMQTFEAIYTVFNKNGDWRVIQRNPIIISRA